MKDLTPTKVDRLNILTTIGSIEALSEPLMTINKMIQLMLHLRITFDKYSSSASDKYSSYLLTFYVSKVLFLRYL